jgi:lysophospholipase L1-like esterase
MQNRRMADRFSRYVALGDSFTEGVGDPDPTRPNGLRGWADRVAEQLAVDNAELGYANLAIRGRKLPQIIEEQVGIAVDLEPDLVTIYAGANDMLRPRVDVDALAADYDEAIGRLTATGARVVMFTAFDPVASPGFRSLRGRFATYSEHVREIADGHGAVIVDFWRLRLYRDWRYWDEDRLHMNTFGHQQMALEVLDTLGVEHTLTPPDLPELVVPGFWEHLSWGARHVAPWVRRRVTGRSSGDEVSPKRPGLAPI